MKSTHPGFTLIELLVVITIIVVLLALLTPALDKAIYQAELAVCMATQNAVVASTIAYAAGNKRRYPYRPQVEDPENNMIPYEIARSDGDDRPVLSSYLAINKHLNDPFTIETDFEDTPPTARVFTDFSLWFGWHYNGRKGLKKLGDRMVAALWIDPDSEVQFPPAARETKRFDVMIGDHWFQGADGTRLFEVAHPDRGGAAQERDLGKGVTGDSSSNTLGVGWTWTLQHADARATAYSFDLNFGMSDGSVVRIDDLRTPFGDYSGRVHFLPNSQNESGSLVIVPAGN